VPTAVGQAGADLQRGEVDLCASFSYNLSTNFEGFWSNIKHEDLLAHEVMTTKSTLAHYDRYGPRRTEGMAALSDRYRIEKMAVVVADQPDNPVSLFMSAQPIWSWGAPYAVGLAGSRD